MEKDLTSARCVPCRGGVPPLDAGRIEALRPQVPAWDIVEVDGIRRLRRDYAFTNFRQALDFTIQVGELAEREEHHPDITLSWGRARVEVWTHKIRGLHENDFILAAKADRIYEAAPHA